VAVVEDNVRVAGVGASVGQLLRDAGFDVPVLDLGIPREFLDHAGRGEILADIGLHGQAVARRVVEAYAGRELILTDAPRAEERT
jgi:1-deoxy-D-xylulose-5-phosphate synthase